LQNLKNQSHTQSHFSQQHLHPRNETTTSMNENY
jgi:hypothetical protein